MSYSRNWGSAVYLPPWKTSMGNDWEFDAGLRFDDEKTFIYLGLQCNGTNINSVGTQVFHVDDLGGRARTETGYSPISNASNECLTAKLYTQIIGTNVDIAWAWQRINCVTGAESLVEAGSLSSGLPLDADGTLNTQYISPTGTEVHGTWQMIVTYDGTALGTVDTTAENWTPSTGSFYRSSMYGMTDNPDNAHFVFLTSEYAFDNVIAPVERTFWYEGDYNNGSSNGIYNLTAPLITVSKIQQYLYLPGIDGAFSSTIDVTVKNDSNQWGTFTGHAVSGTSYNPSGVFYVADTNIAAGEETLFAGFLDYKTIQIDALNQTVSFQLNSVLSGLLDKPLCPVSHITEENAADQKFYGVVRPQIIPSVQNIDRDFGSESGTITLSGKASLKAGELLTVQIDGTTSQDEFMKISSVFEDSGGSSSFYLEKIPTWLNTGDSLLRNKAYPDDIASAAINGYEFFNDFLRLPLSLYNADGKDSWGGADLSWDIADNSGSNSLRAALESVIISPSQYIYGDETFIDVLNEFLKAAGGGGASAYDGQTINLFVPSPSVALQDAAGTLNYEENALGGFTASKDSPLKSIYIQYAYSEDARKYLENTTVETDFPYGEEKKISTWLINFNEDARNLGFLISTFFSSGATISFQTTTDNWALLAPGKRVDISNVPAEFETAGTKFLTLLRGYDKSTKIVETVMQEITLDTYEFFKVGVHDIGGSVGVL